MLPITKSAICKVRSNAQTPMNATANTLIVQMPLKPLIVTVRRATARLSSGSATNSAKANNDKVAKVVCVGRPTADLVSMGIVVDVGNIEKKRAIGMDNMRPRAWYRACISSSNGVPFGESERSVSVAEAFRKR